MSMAQAIDFFVRYLLPFLVFVFFLSIIIYIAKRLRIVVQTNEVHIVQSTKKTTSYGKDQGNGNTYYRWPSWIPLIGVMVTELPVSVFPVRLENYSAYDKDRVPFHVDVMAFFRITDSNQAATRISKFEEMETQLLNILQGAIRAVLASYTIQQILEGRATFGEAFTREVDGGLKEWGVQSVKTVELMDIRDEHPSQAIHNIMAMKQAEIERDSRSSVAANMQRAEIAEIEARREVGVQQQQAEELVGKRTAEKELNVGVARQEAEQKVLEARKETTAKEVAVAKLKLVGDANNKAEAALVEANNLKAIKVVEAEAQQQAMAKTAEGQKQKVTLEAEGEQAAVTARAEGEKQRLLKVAEGIEAEGKAKGAAETAIQMAPVNAQIALATKISTDEGYQAYLIQIRQVEAQQAIGVAQAEAIKAAEIKIIANSGTVTGGIKSVSDLFSTQGGTAIGAALEALSQTEVGKRVIDKVVPTNPESEEVSLKKLGA